MLQAEISSIQELLDEQPDSKCEYQASLPVLIVLTVLTGCMESLVHYKQLLLRKHSASIAAEERETIEKACLDLLQQLQTLDSERRNRYEELGAYNRSAL